ncbi:hypothetical protein Esi_0126_0074 [Ectocarpus siliculosus]|uniref:PX domain-containing protein n=1 Tax=Ectocarpus siliculosus TaxID=2880 RepID=D8LDV4_ECTSI|nr:hypothetical protein Esi_0126_0074 [Ectocarpus siliculosus]|eukprot:CBN78511.1 hypothetical protein Esi_0126_0074 [Ectocarpus siliculosus]
MALEQYLMPSDASRRDAHLPDTTLVEGYVVEHALRWKSNSVAGYLNAGGGIDLGAGAPADVAQLQRAPRVSVTLSEYLSAASPHADPSCDYGWYTPTASASSLPAAENSSQEGCYPAPPSPSAYPSSLPWRCNRVEVESTATVSLSPESIVLGGGGGGSTKYLVVVCMGREKLVAGWRRASDFEKLAAIARKAWMPKSCVAWEALERARRVDGGGPCNMPVVLRPRRLDSVYLQNKARFLEEFLKQYFFEAGSKDALLSFLDLKKPATAEV